MGTSGRNLLGGGYIEAASSSPAQSPHGLAPAAAVRAAPAAGPRRPASRGRRVQVGTGAAALVDDEGVSQGRLLMLNRWYIRDILLRIIQGIFEALKLKNWLIRALNQFHVT